MFIKYSGTNCHAMGNINKASLAAMKTPGREAKALIQSPQDVKWLRPGWNEFSTECWDQNKNHPQIVKMIKKNIIEIMNHTAKVKVRDKKGKVKLVQRLIGQDDRPVRLTYFDEKSAVKIAKETWNRELLQRWLDEERRHKVAKVLRKQIEPLLNKSSDDDDDEDDDDGIEDEEDFD
jgi:hypothetical protein